MRTALISFLVILATALAMFMLVLGMRAHAINTHILVDEITTSSE